MKFAPKITMTRLAQRTLSFICIGIAISLPYTKAETKITKDAQAVLDQLPSKSLTLELIVSQALQYADQFKVVMADKNTIPNPYLQSLAPLEPTLTFSTSRSDDQSDSTGTFITESAKQTAFSLGLAKKFSTGTETTASIGFNDNSLRFNFSGTTSTSNYLESIASITVKQSLWKDSFGKSTRANLEAGELSTQASANVFQNALESGVLELIELYYLAWEIKKRALVDEAAFKRQERFLNITKIKRKRGTADPPDLIEVENFYTQSRYTASNTKKALQEIWRKLVVSVGLPKHWGNIDAMLIPIKIDDPIERATKACGSQDSLNPTPKENAQLLAAQFRSKAATLNEIAARSDRDPDLYVKGSLASNGQDASNFGTTFSEMAASENPAWSVELGLSIPLAGFASRAKLFQATAEKEKADAQLGVVRGDLNVDWINFCRDFYRTNEFLKSLEANYKKQTKRVNMEERRFKIGRIPANKLIVAESDSKQAEFLYLGALKETRMLSWKILRLSGDMKKILEDFLNTKFNIEMPKEAAPGAS